MNPTLFYNNNPSLKHPAWDADSHFKYLAQNKARLEAVKLQGGKKYDIINTLFNNLSKVSYQGKLFTYFT